jgi:hypothetical protein
MAILKEWPPRIIISYTFLFAGLALISFACYLLLPWVRTTGKMPVLVLYLPFIIAVASRGYYIYNISSGKLVEMNFSFSIRSSQYPAWYGKIAECVIVLAVCIIAHWKYQKMKVTDPGYK